MSNSAQRKRPWLYIVRLSKVLNSKLLIIIKIQQWAYPTNKKFSFYYLKYEVWVQKYGIFQSKKEFTKVSTKLYVFGLNLNWIFFSYVKSHIWGRVLSKITAKTQIENTTTLTTVGKHGSTGFLLFFF